ncbi:hypothetical protein RIF29_32280 [Crotalaria pallida]|uniref:Uncharacterized protein n=1 Tax=Crotalaria pallida TaxID=3830 RepID=A0AAN9EQ62_CROPI
MGDQGESPDSLGKDLLTADKESSDAQQKSNPFGPWMLVKRHARKKERALQKQNGSSIMGGIKGVQHVPERGKFDALNYEEEVALAAGPDDSARDTQVSLHEEVYENQHSKHVVGNPKRVTSQAHKEVKVRNFQAGKNQQLTRGIKVLMQPAKATAKQPRQSTINKESVAKNIITVEAPSAMDGQHNLKQYRGSKEYKEAMKAKEEEVMRLMKFYEKSKGLVIHDFATQTYLPEKEAIEFAQRNASSSKSLNLPPKPPDGKLSSGSGMDIDYNDDIHVLSENDKDILIPGETDSLNHNLNM